MSTREHTAPLTHRMETVGKDFCTAAIGDCVAAR